MALLGFYVFYRRVWDFIKDYKSSLSSLLGYALLIYALLVVSDFLYLFACGVLLMSDQTLPKYHLRIVEFVMMAKNFPLSLTGRTMLLATPLDMFLSFVNSFVLLVVILVSRVVYQVSRKP